MGCNKFITFSVQLFMNGHNYSRLAFQFLNGFEMTQFNFRIIKNFDLKLRFVRFAPFGEKNLIEKCSIFVTIDLDLELELDEKCSH